MTTMTTAPRTISINGTDRSADSQPRMNVPDWLAPIRKSALEAFETLGLPTTNDEDWRQTNLSTLAKIEFTPADPQAADQIGADVIDRFRIPGLECRLVVFVNGAFVSSLSDDVEAAADGVIIMPLTEAWEKHPDVIRNHLAQYAEYESSAFTALNTSSFTDGMFMFIPASASLGKPIHILNLTSTNADSAVITHPRNLIVAEHRSEATVIEDYGSVNEDDGPYFTNAVTEIKVDAEARVHHYFIERESRQAFNVSTLRIHQEDNSRFESHSALLGAGLVRNNVLPKLAGDHCWSVLNGLYVGEADQRIDNFMRVEHDNTNGESRQYYKGILSGESQATFSGRIVVAKPAQKTDAVQSNQNLLLSEDARAFSKPQLEIYADDVKCTHGATIGEIDESAVFYLRSRGMSLEVARALLLHAFIVETLERMELEPVSRFLESLVVDRLPNGDILREFL